MTNQSIPKRSEVPEEMTWNLKDMFESDQAWMAEYEAMKAWGRGERWIPTVCAVLGGILGAVGLYVMPGFPANDVITAAAIGMVSGLAATGAHQAVKQLCTGPDCGKTQ